MSLRVSAAGFKLNKVLLLYLDLLNDLSVPPEELLELCHIRLGLLLKRLLYFVVDGQLREVLDLFFNLVVLGQTVFRFL
jgi:hypothetical protein